MPADQPERITVRRVDYHAPDDQTALVSLLDAYARDPMGGATALPIATRNTLCERLAGFAGAASWIAWAEDVSPVGLLNAFIGFSTFRAQPLLNVHDLAVLPHWRGQGIAHLLLDAAQEHARALNCCKLTLEVLSSNQAALQAYQRFGFTHYALNAAQGQALFMQKWLP